MANIVIKKEIIVRGDKGDTGDTSIDTTAPINAIFYFDENVDAPTGYVDFEE